MQETEFLYIEVRREERTTLRVANPHRKRKNQEFLKMFEMGYSTKGDNRGVGLYQVKKLAQKYKCELVAENQVMDGKNYVCFTLKI
ncbi:MAG: GHKL domain-containing protein [Eubacterium sp.]|jgi:sensor histidine kinase regulating citrate/malate metabolism|nr:GHKL domain-containing protein [Eubacterium sp.]